jgi:hypothetical protein
MHLQKKRHGGLRCATRGLQLKVSSKLGLGAKPATPKNVRHSASPFAPLFNSATPLPQLRKINRTLQNAVVENQLKNLHGGLRFATRGCI